MSRFVKVLLASSVACLILSTSPPLAAAAALAWGIILLLGGCWLGGRPILIVFGLNTLLLFGLAGNSILFFLLIFGLPSLIMALQLGRQKGYYEVQTWGMLSALLVVGIFLGVAYYAGQSSAFTVSPQEIEIQVDANLKMLEDTGLLHLYEQQGLSPEELKSQFTAIYGWSIRHLPAWYFIQAILAVFLILRLGTYLGRTQGLLFADKRLFAEEAMPWPIAWAVIAGLILMLSGWGTGNIWYYTGSNIVLTVAPIAIYFGVATLVYLWRRMSARARRWWGVILILNVMFFTLPAIFFVALLGLFDSLLDYRGLEPKKEG